MRPSSPSSSVGSQASGISHPPGARKRRRITLSDVSSDVLLDSINDWDDGQMSRQSLAETSSGDLTFSDTFPIYSLSPPRSPASVLSELSDSRDGSSQIASGPLAPIATSVLPPAPPAPVRKTSTGEAMPRRPPTYEEGRRICLYYEENKTAKLSDMAGMVGNPTLPTLDLAWE